MDGSAARFDDDVGRDDFLHGSQANDLGHDARARLGLPDRLFDLDELDVFYDQRNAALWTFMRPAGRPSFTLKLLDDFANWQRLIGEGFAGGEPPLRFILLGSRVPGVFGFGGDLDLFQAFIRAGDRAGLVDYGYRCVEILHRNLNALGLPVVTVGVVQGAALGGGFEALLSFDHLIAERSASFGLPEVRFGLFPGMGAHALLARKLGSAQADRLILSNKTYTAEEMYDLGLVHQLAKPGEGVAAARAFVARNGRRQPGLYGAKQAMRRAIAVSLDELKRIVEDWADSALQLEEQDLRLMNKLTAAQIRRSDAA